MCEKRIVADGKTKTVIRSDTDKDLVMIVSKDEITADDGKRRNKFGGKAELATTTTCNVFEFLKSSGLPVAYRRRINSISFEAPLCRMFPLEVVVRRYALGSYCKRNPEIGRMTRLEPLVVEFFLKTTKQQFREYSFPKDDQYVADIIGGHLYVCRPDMPNTDDATWHAVPLADVLGTDDRVVLFDDMRKLARSVFIILEQMWGLQHCTLADIKMEFGLDAQSQLCIADVIDNDSWRLFDVSGNHLDKQRYRDRAPLDEVQKLYEEVARRTYMLLPSERQDALQ